ncbi:MAG: NAD-dependent epimerase/dehydratase family protein [Candidatus Baltobacteraceae bacterium]
MKHLVTGGSGFLGNLIARRLFERGDDVVNLDIWEDPSRPAGIEFVNCDILDREGVARAMRGIEVVHHNVALVPITKAGQRFWDVNVTGSQITAEEAVKAGVKQFIHQSSSAIFGAVEAMPVTSTTVPKPVESYGAAKLASEQVVKDACTRGGVPLTIVRPRTILGPGRLGIFGILFKWITENRNVYVIGDGNTLFQFVHAADLMDAYMLALDQSRPGVYNVGTDRFGTLREALEDLIGYAGSSSRVVGLPRGLTKNALRVLDWTRMSPLGPYHYNVYGKPFYFDVAPLLAMGFKPQYSNEEMMRATFDWWLAHRADAVDEGASAHRKPIGEKFLSLVRRFS